MVSSSGSATRRGGLLALAAAGIVLAGVQAQAAPKTMEPGKLTIGINGDMPMTSLKDGKLIGTDGELIAAIAGRLGLEVNVVQMEWSALIQATKQGKVDLMLGSMGWTKERSQVMLLSDPIYYFGTFLLQKNSSSFSTFEDMKGHSVGTVTGFTLVPELKSGGRYDARAEQFGLGALGLMMVSARPMDRAIETKEEILSRLGPGLGSTLARLVDTDPARRFSDVAEVEVSLGAPPPRAAAQCERICERNWRVRSERGLLKNSAGGAISTFSVVLLLALVSTYFFLAQGRTIWLWFIRLLPLPTQQPLHDSFRRGWLAVLAYSRTQIIVAAVDAVGAIVKNDDYVLGGAQSIPSTSFQEAGLPLLDGECFMHRQASFYSTLWPEGTTVAPDGDIYYFYLPSPADGRPLCTAPSASATPSPAAS